MQKIPFKFYMSSNILMTQVIYLKGRVDISTQKKEKDELIPCLDYDRKLTIIFYYTRHMFHKLCYSLILKGQKYLIFTFVEDSAKEPDVAWSEKTFLIALASIESPD